MDIRNVANQGNVERAGDRTKKAGPLRTVVIPAVARDEAKISSAGRETAAAIEGLAERARRDGPERDAVVAEARRKLMSGELDAPSTTRATAQRLLDAGFVAG